MPTWLEIGSPVQAQPSTLALRLLLAFGLGLLAAEIRSRTNGSGGGSFRATMVLLTILIAAVTQVIGDNVARAFSLVGALSIVRFRTVVQDTRDTAFVIFAVTLGMAVGAGDLWVAGLALLVVGAAAAAVGRTPPAPGTGPVLHLAVTLGLGYDAGSTLASHLQRHAAAARMVASATVSRGAAIETTWEVRLHPDTEPAAVVQDLNELDGVQGVQIRPAPSAS